MPQTLISKRRERAHLIEEREKKALALHRRLDEVHDLQWNLGEVELEEPRWHGYQMNWELRPYLPRKLDPDILKKLLGMINITAYSKSKKFVEYDRYRHCWVYNQPTLKDLSEREWLALSVWEQPYFYRAEDYARWSREPVFVYRFKYRELLKPKITAHFITHVKAMDLELEKEEDWLRYKLYNENELNIYWMSIDNYSHHQRYGSKWRKAFRKSRAEREAIDKLIRFELWKDHIREEEMKDE